MRIRSVWKPASVVYESLRFASMRCACPTDGKSLGSSGNTFPSGAMMEAAAPSKMLLPRGRQPAGAASRAGAWTAPHDSAPLAAG